MGELGTPWLEVSRGQQVALDPAWGSGQSCRRTAPAELTPGVPAVAVLVSEKVCVHLDTLPVGQAQSGLAVSWARGPPCPGLGTGAARWGRWGRLQVFGSDLGSLGDGGKGWSRVWGCRVDTGRGMPMEERAGATADPWAAELSLPGMLTEGGQWSSAHTIPSSSCPLALPASCPGEPPGDGR